MCSNYEHSVPSSLLRWIQRIPCEHVGYLSFEFIKVKKALHHIAVGLEGTGITHKGVISRDDENGQVGISGLDICKQARSLESV